MARILTDFENHLRTELLTVCTEPYDVASPRDELEKFRFFVREIESFVDQAEKSEVDSLRKTIQHIPKDDQDEFWQWHYPVHWDEIFRFTIRGSVVVSLATLLETLLKRLCYRVALVKKDELSSADGKGSTLKRARRFLQKVGHFRKPASAAWDEMETFFKIRNVIVHERGFAEGSRYKEIIKSFCHKRSDIRLHHGEIEIEPEFLEFIINQLIAFVGQLEDEFRLLCERTRKIERS